MSSQNNYLGEFYVTPDFVAGYGQSYSPSTVLSSMNTSQLYYQEFGESDVIMINCENFMIACFKTFQVQKLLNMFCARSASISGSDRIRWIHRGLATLFSFSDALRAVGVDATIPDAWTTSADIIAANTALAPYFIQVWRAP